MKSIDVIIISDAKDDGLKAITQRAIDSARRSEYEFYINCIIVEKQDVFYNSAVTVKQSGQFCYNRFLNEGAALGNSEYIAFCNNDLLFDEFWATNIIGAMKYERARSACPYSPVSYERNRIDIKPNSGVYYGHEIRREFCGWCFVWERKLWEEIKLDERINFWASDNSAAEQLKEKKEKHILVTDSIVHHVNNGSTTLNLLPLHERSKYMHDELKKFNRLYDKNYFGIGKDIEGKVTVVIPVFGDMNYWKPLLERAHQSALNQTVKAKYVIINTGKDLHESRNSIINSIDTEFVIFLDCDDELHENYIEEMLKIEDADVVVPCVHRYFDDGRVDTDQHWYTPRPLVEANYIVIGALVRTEYLKRVGGFSDLPLYEDWQMWLRMEEIGARFKQCPAAIYKIHVREGSRNEPDIEMKQKMYNQIRNEALKRRNKI